MKSNFPIWIEYLAFKGLWRHVRSILGMPEAGCGGLFGSVYLCCFVIFPPLFVFNQLSCLFPINLSCFSFVDSFNLSKESVLWMIVSFSVRAVLQFQKNPLAQGFFQDLIITAIWEDFFLIVSTFEVSNNLQRVKILYF